jgi:hypothetical protein
MADQRGLTVVKDKLEERLEKLQPPQSQELRWPVAMLK